MAKDLRGFDLTKKSPRQFERSSLFGDFDNADFQVSLLPVPYLGDLKKADIFVLMLNPGLGLSDYITEHDPEHARAHRAIIRQKLKGFDFPFISLDPRFAWTGGFHWWEKKLRGVVTEIARTHDVTYWQALRNLSRRLAAIELFPYHSIRFKGSKKLGQLPSVIAARTFVNEVLVPRAKRGELKIIAARKVKAWGIKRSLHVVTYSGGQSRGASLGPNTPGGKAILHRIKNFPRHF